MRTEVAAKTYLQTTARTDFTVKHLLRHVTKRANGRYCWQWNGYTRARDSEPLFADRRDGKHVIRPARKMLYEIVWNVKLDRRDRVVPKCGNVLCVAPWASHALVTRQMSRDLPIGKLHVIDGITVDDHLRNSFQVNENGCRIWHGALNRGYPVVKGPDTGLKFLHRILWKDRHGERATDSVQFSWQCGDKRCLNFDPAHCWPRPVTSRNHRAVRIPTRQEFEAHTRIDGGCIIWTGRGSTNCGIPFITSHGKKYSIRRLAAYFATGEFPDAPVTAPRCGNALCVKWHPWHLFAEGSRRVEARRMA